jgi:hypothetical protein
VRDLSLAWDYWKVFKLIKSWSQVQASLQIFGDKPSREFNGPYSTSALLLPAMAFIVLLHHIILILCAARPHVQIPQSHFIMDGTSITSNQKTTLILIASLPQEFVTG